MAGTTVSTSSTTGALVVSGGVGIAKSVYIGENLDVGGNLSCVELITYDDIHNIRFYWYCNCTEQVFILLLVVLNKSGGGL